MLLFEKNSHEDNLSFNLFSFIQGAPWEGFIHTKIGFLSGKFILGIYDLREFLV